MASLKHLNCYFNFNVSLIKNGINRNISLSCVLIARFLKLRIAFLATWGFILGWAQFLAAFLDAIENFALIYLILDSQREIWPIIAWWCAMVKFGIVGAGLVYILPGTLFVLTLKSFAFKKR